MHLKLPTLSRRAAYGLLAVGLTASTPFVTATTNRAYAAVLGAKTVVSNTALITIRDNAVATPFPSGITVSGLTGAVSKVTVTLYGFSHEWMNDVELVLVGPTGVKAGLMMRAGTGNQSFSNTTMTFDDDAASTIAPLAGQVLTGTLAFKPTVVSGSMPTLTGPFPASLAGFNNVDPNGTWGLYANDWDSIKSGSVTGGWSIEITTPGTAPTVAAVANVSRNNDAGACYATIVAPTPAMTGIPTPTLSLLPAWPVNNRVPVGPSTSFTATAANGTTPDATRSFDVSVADNENPVITLPSGLTSPVTVPATNASGAVVTYSAVTSTDNCSSTVARTAGLASGSTFPIGDTVVTHTATDPSSNTATVSFTVSVGALPATIPPSTSTVPEATTTTTVPEATTTTVPEATTTTTTSTTTTSTTTTTAPTTTTSTTLAPPVLVAPVWVDSSLAPMSYKTPYADQVSATGNPIPTYALSGTLAAGMSFNEARGTVEGIASGGAYDFTIVASNSVGSISQRFTGTVTIPGVSLKLEFQPGASLEGSGAPANIAGEGLLPGSTYTSTVRSTPRVVGTGRVGADGSFSDTIAIPADIEVGSHELTVSGISAEGLEVTAKAWFNVNANGTIGAISTTGPVGDASVSASGSASGGASASTIATAAAAVETNAAVSAALVSDSDLALTGSPAGVLGLIALALATTGTLIVGLARRQRPLRD